MGRRRQCKERSRRCGLPTLRALPLLLTLLFAIHHGLSFVAPTTARRPALLARQAESVGSPVETDADLIKKLRQWKGGKGKGKGFATPGSAAPASDAPAPDAPAPAAKPPPKVQ